MSQQPNKTEQEIIDGLDRIKDEFKITLDFLKINPECWKWIASKTRSWEYCRINNGINNYRTAICADSRFRFYIDQFQNNIECLESIIYQAIDGINGEYNYCIQQGSGFAQAFKHGESANGIVFDSPKYDRTAARLELLQWIWQQETGGDNAK